PPTGSGAHLLLPHTDEVRVGPVRRVLRARSARADRQRAGAPAPGGDRRLGPRDLGTRNPLCHELTACCAEDPPILLSVARCGLSACRYRILPPDSPLDGAASGQG